MLMNRSFHRRLLPGPTDSVCLKTLKNVVILILSIYDEPEVQLAKCSGVVVSENTILTNRHCVALKSNIASSNVFKKIKIKVYTKEVWNKKQTVEPKPTGTVLSIYLPDRQPWITLYSDYVALDVAILKFQPEYSSLLPTNLLFFNDPSFNSIYDRKFTVCQASAVPEFTARQIKPMFSPVLCRIKHKGGTSLSEYYQCHTTFLQNGGDSGGPIFAMHNNFMYLIGITSRTANFTQGGTSLTDEESVPLFTFFHWLHKVLGKRIEFDPSAINLPEIPDGYVGASILRKGGRFRGSITPFQKYIRSTACAKSKKFLGKLECRMNGESQPPLFPDEILGKAVFDGLIEGWRNLDARSLDRYSFCDIPYLTKDAIFRVCFSKRNETKTVFFQEKSVFYSDSKIFETVEYGDGPAEITSFFVNPTTTISPISPETETWTNQLIIPSQRENIRVKIKTNTIEVSSVTGLSCSP